MRIVYVSDLVETWYQLLVRFIPTKSLIVNMTWDILSAYISWIDINLVASERFIALLLKCLGDIEFLEAATDCLCSLVTKGMDAKLKLQLIVALEEALKRCPLFTVSSDVRANPDKSL
ncbi:unnamed protein product [Soboliphyme baturini]|uniref:Exportin-T n=1 Tax=Soboliphyme baturini TaxID=241478 RepID=A0A183J9G5_9BILA|nr:unnamed protein product [Soboliphyme baturini]